MGKGGGVKSDRKRNFSVRLQILGIFLSFPLARKLLRFINNCPFIILDKQTEQVKEDTDIHTDT